MRRSCSGTLGWMATTTCAAIIEDVMARQGWNANDFARYTGIDSGTVSRVLNGRRSLRFDTLVKGLERIGFRLRLDGPDADRVDAVAANGPPDATPSRTMANDSPYEPHLLRELFILMNASPTDDPAVAESISSGALWDRLRAIMDTIVNTPAPWHERVAFSRAVTRVRTRQWQAFLAGLYRTLHWNFRGNLPLSRQPAEISPRHYRLEEAWTPLPSTGFEPCRTRMDISQRPDSDPFDVNCFDDGDPVGRLADVVFGFPCHTVTEPYKVVVDPCTGKSVKTPTRTLAPFFLQYNVLIPKSALPSLRRQPAGPH